MRAKYKSRRKGIPIRIEKAVLAKSRRRCTLCFGLHGDKTEKRGQIAHLDGNRANNKESNLAWMCLDHHSLFDSTTKQHKNYTISEVKEYRRLLHKVLRSAPQRSSRRARRSSVSKSKLDRSVKVTNSPVASGANISQTINSPTLNLSLPAPTSGTPGRERYDEWRDLIDEIHESIQRMGYAFMPLVPVQPGDDHNDYQEGIRRGNRVLGSRILIADAVQKAGLKKDWDELVQYTHSARGPIDRWQQGSPTMGGFDKKAREFQEKLMRIARQDMAVLHDTELPPQVPTTPEVVLEYECEISGLASTPLSEEIMKERRKPLTLRNLGGGTAYHVKVADVASGECAAKFEEISHIAEKSDATALPTVTDHAVTRGVDMENASRHDFVRLLERTYQTSGHHFDPIRVPIQVHYEDRNGKKYETLCEIEFDYFKTTARTRCEPPRPNRWFGTIDALRAIQQGQKPAQETMLRLRDQGLIEVADVTNFQSTSREYIPTVLTAKGLRLLETEQARIGEPVSTNQKAASSPSTKRWDVFISHASEDKEEIAHPLAEALKQRGFAVWYDKFTLKLGDSLRESIDRGLAESRFGVVILSKHFFAKRWPSKELNGLTAIEIGGEKVILPVWHGVTHDDVMKYSPILADRKAVNTGEGLDRVVAAIEEVLNPPMTEDLHEQLHEAEETLQEYRCPHCGSPLSTRSSVPLSEHDDGTYEDFECGYAHIDGHMQCPCPSDPKFPKLDDYEFVCKELQGDSYWKWECFANAKTREARMLSLMRGLGRTKEEAREQVEKRYNDHAKPWRKR